MNDNEAKFLLQAYRPDGRDAQDPLFADVLTQVKNDPALQSWLKREGTFDRAIIRKLGELQPPPELRDAILAGGRASQPPPARWRKYTWMALAASVALACFIALRLPHAGPSAHDFAEFALHELATSREQHGGSGPAHAQLQAILASAALPFPGRTQLDPARLRRAGCHTINYNGHEVFEICFTREGKTFHLYAADMKDFITEPANALSLVITKGRFTATAWQEDRFTYALVTEEGAPALRRLI